MKTLIRLFSSFIVWLYNRSLIDDITIQELYQHVEQRESFVVTAQEVYIKKGKRRYTLIVIKTKDGELRFNIGRYPTEMHHATQKNGKRTPIMGSYDEFRHWLDHSGMMLSNKQKDKLCDFLASKTEENILVSNAIANREMMRQSFKAADHAQDKMKGKGEMMQKENLDKMGLMSDPDEIMALEENSEGKRKTITTPPPSEEALEIFGRHEFNENQK